MASRSKSNSLKRVHPVSAASSSPDAPGTRLRSGGDAERCHLRIPTEAPQPPAGLPQQSRITDMEPRQPSVSVHLLPAGLFRAGEGALQDRDVVLQPVCNRYFGRKGNKRGLRSLLGRAR